MKVNLITSLNGVGLQRDAEILNDELIALGHSPCICDHKKPIQQAAVNIFLEILKPEDFRFAPINILIPNPEWFLHRWTAFLPMVTQVWHKTACSMDAFKKLHKSNKFIGFTSKDCYNPAVSKTVSAIHIAGKSEMKSTRAVISAWAIGGLPDLTIIGERLYPIPHRANIRHIKRATEADLMYLMNQSTIHVCPSQAEGWGHYIHEGASTGAQIITTDAQPMNEFGYEGGLVKCHPGRIHGLSTMVNVAPADIHKAVKECANVQSSKNREIYLRMKTEFQLRLSECIKEL